MTIKLLQLNMWQGKLFPALEKYLSQNTFDILNFQEVERVTTEENGYVNCFERLQRILGNDYIGKIAIHNTFTSGSNRLSQGNATFFRKEFTLLDEKIFWLYKRDSHFPHDASSFEDMGRNFLHLTLQIADKPYEVISAHLAWAPTPLEQPHQREQNKKLITYIASLKNPFILTGDFNVKPDQPTIIDLEKYGKNVTKEYKVKNTLDPKSHRAWEKVKPGFPVDYIFVSSNIKVKKFKLLEDVSLSDHLGLTAEIEI